MTLVVNLFAGPGTGKSTHASLVFGALKVAGVNAEIASEYAKDLTWEGRHKALRYQPYVTAKQMYRVHRLLGQVDVVVTDSPILLALIYRGDGYTQAFEDFVLASFREWRTLNVFLERNATVHPYNPVGRGQTEDEATLIDDEIRHLLERHEIPHEAMRVREDGLAAQDIADRVCREIA